MKHIYEQLKEAGIEIDNHESDLYCPVNDVSTAIIENWKKEPGVNSVVSTFIYRSLIPNCTVDIIRITHNNPNDFLGNIIYVMVGYYFKLSATL